MRFRDDESGQVLAVTVFCLVILSGFMALALDVGTLFRAKRNVQIAADAAAVAAAWAYAYPGKVSVTQSAYNAASATGVTNPNNVTVNQPPTSGYHTGSSYVEVIINQPNPTFFMGILTGTNSLGVSARAVAGLIPAPACILVLNSNAADAMDWQGSADLQTTNCGVQVNSTSPNAVCIQGHAQLNAPFLDITGAQNPSGKCGQNGGGLPINPGSLPMNDPFNGLTGPTPANGQCSSVNSTTTTLTGSIAGPGFGSSVCYTKTITLNGTTMGAGTYVFENGVTVSGTVTVNGGTIDVEGGQFTQGNAILNITAPTSGTYNSIALMEPASNTTDTCQDPKTTAPCIQIQFGSGSGSLQGYIYVPTGQVYMQDNGGGVEAEGIIADTMYDKSSQLTINNNYNIANAGTSVVNKVTLVE